MRYLVFGTLAGTAIGILAAWIAIYGSGLLRGLVPGC